MSLRTETRVIQETAVRVFGMSSQGQPISVPARTVDVSRHGARVCGVSGWDVPGETIGVRCGMEKARFRIVWVGSDGSRLAGQIGLQCLEIGKYIWDSAPSNVAAPSVVAPFPPRSVGRFISPAIPPTSRFLDSRRNEHRFTIQGGASVREVGRNVRQWATLQDLSLGGCYVETNEPLSPFTLVDVSIHVDNARIEARGTVTVKHPLVGMGIQFTEMTPLNRECLRRLISGIERARTAGANF